MNYRLIVKIIGHLLMVEAAALALPMLVSMYYGEAEAASFALSLLICLGVGVLLSCIKARRNTIKIREGMAIVTFGWVFFSIFGALPFLFSGTIPNLADAIFETVSGFSTTGASILTEIEGLPLGILFWRSFTHWLGGMGILVFTLALLPKMGAGSFQIIKAESPGPVSEKVAPRVKNTAIILYLIYMGMTILEIILLMFGGLDFYEAAVHAFGTVGTGGFSSKNTSIGYYSPYIQWVITIFMFASGTNFALYYLCLKGKLKKVFADEEFRLYVSISIGAIVLLVLNLWNSGIYDTLAETIRHSAFQTAAIITTTGYSTTDFDAWPTVSKAILMLLFFIGGCAGSTGGGIKNIRILVVLKSMKVSLMKVLHPKAVVPVKVNGKTVSHDTIFSIFSFIMIWAMIVLVGTIVVALNGFPLLDSFSAVAVTLGNIGPGFGVVGPTSNFAAFSDGMKYFFSFLMLIGRLELYTVLVLFLPNFWKDAH
ncbi:MAG: TrkH family potassium uptake protein [Faecalibacterium sp.]